MTTPARARLGLAALGLLAHAACIDPSPSNPHPCSGPLPDPGPIVLDWPRHRMVYQQHDGVGDVRVRGRLLEVEPAPLLARHAGGPWQRIDPDPLTGEFDGVLADRPIGWGSVEVRLEAAPETGVVIAPVGVGNVVVLAGQSNMVMLLLRRTYTLRGATVLGQGRDPGDPHAVAWAADPLHDCTRPYGSIWPAFGDRLIKTDGAPLMFVATAVGATGLAATGQWLPGGPRFDDMLAQLSLATAEQMCAAALLWLQGELDAQLGTSSDAYRDALLAFAQGVQDAASCPLPVVAGVIGDIAHDTWIDPEAAAGIRAGTLEAIDASPHLHPGPWTLDLPIRYLHFTDAAAAPLLDRWCAAVAAAPTGLACAP